MLKCLLDASQDSDRELSHRLFLRLPSLSAAAHAPLCPRACGSCKSALSPSQEDLWNPGGADQQTGEAQVRLLSCLF